MGLDLAMIRRSGSGSRATEKEVLYLRKGWSMFDYFERKFGMGSDGSTRFIDIYDVYTLIQDFQKILDDYDNNNGSFEVAKDIYPIMTGDIQIEDYDKEYIEHVKSVLAQVKEGIKDFDEQFEDLLIYGSY